MARTQLHLALWRDLKASVVLSPSNYRSFLCSLHCGSVWCAATKSWAFAQGNAWSLEDVLQQLQHPLLRPGCGTVANVVMCWNAVAPPAWIQAKQCTESKTCHGISSNNFQNFTGCYMVLFFYLILCLRECREWVESTDLFQKSQLLPYTRLHVLLHMSQSQMPAGLNCQ